MQIKRPMHCKLTVPSVANTIKGMLEVERRGEGRVECGPSGSVSIRMLILMMIGNAIGPYEDLLTTVKRRKLKWYGHVTRSSGLAKTILQGTVQGGRRRGRQRKRWEDNIKEWTGLPWNIALRKAENREEWRKLVVKSTVVPQRSARLRDR